MKNTIEQQQMQRASEVKKTLVESRDAVKARRKAIKEVRQLELHQFRNALKSGLSLLFYNNGEFADYGIDSHYRIQFKLNDDGYGYTKKELIEEIKRDINFINLFTKVRIVELYDN